MPRRVRNFTAPQQLAALTQLNAAKEAEQLLEVAGSITVALNKVYEEIHQHRVYEVYPVTILQEMVLQGNGGAFEHGPALVPAEELEATAPLWNNVPVLVNHPEDGWALGNEQYITNKDGLGFLAYPWVDSDNKLRAELWIDKATAEQHERWVDIKLQAESGTLEMSTGYVLIQNEEKAGTFKGAKYFSIHRGIIPLHLALLPEATGACSVAAGCGMNTQAEEPGKLAQAINTMGAKIDKLFNSTDAARAANKQNKEGAEMTREQMELMAALQANFDLTEEEATKLATNCDCPQLTAKVTAGITTLAENASKVEGLEESLETTKAELKVFIDAKAEEAAEERKGHLTALNMSDEDEATLAIPTSSLAFMAQSKAEAPEGKVDITKSAEAAQATPGDTVPVRPAPVSTLKTKEG